MITSEQLNDLSQAFQIDRFTVFREYLQLLFLNTFYQQKFASKVYFKGGTALRLLFKSPRFSEDLDFSTPYNRTEIKAAIKKTQSLLEKQLPGVKIMVWYQGKKSIRFRLRYKASDFKYPFNIRLDFNEEDKMGEGRVSSLMTDFPLVFFPLINHLSDEEILAEKIRALLVRAKGRDMYDIWFLLEKGIKINPGLIKKKLKTVDKTFDQKILLKKIGAFSEKRLKQDLDKFLPQSQRAIIKSLKNRLLKILKFK